MPDENGLPKEWSEWDDFLREKLTRSLSETYKGKLALGGEVELLLGLIRRYGTARVDSAIVPFRKKGKAVVDTASVTVAQALQFLSVLVHERTVGQDVKEREERAMDATEAILGYNQAAWPHHFSIAVGTGGFYTDHEMETALERVDRTGAFLESVGARIREYVSERRKERKANG